MKFILFLLISVNCLAGSYMPKSLVGQDTTGRKIYLSMSKCMSAEGEACIDISNSGNFSYSTVVPTTQMKEDVVACSGEDDCQSKLEAIECSNENAIKIRNAEHTEAYCTWVREEHIGEDSSKKVEHDNKQAKKIARAARKARGAEARQKCKDALDYVAGGNLESDLTEEQVDAMQAAFADIFGALQANRPGKALRLINNVTDPTYAEMKENLIEILQ